MAGPMTWTETGSPEVLAANVVTPAVRCGHDVGAIGEHAERQSCHVSTVDVGKYARASAPRHRP